MVHLIIGYGVSAHWAVKSIRKYAPDDKIIVVTEESNLCYFKAFLSDYMLGKRTVGDLSIPNKGFFDNKVTLLMEKKVETLDIENKFVVLGTGEKISYDKALIASGMRCPDRNGFEIDGVFRYSSVKDIDRIKSYLGDEIKKIIVIGANFIAFEMINGLKKLGHNVSLFTEQEYPGCDLWDKKISDTFLGKILSEENIISGTKIKRVLSDDNRVTGIETEDGRTIFADLIGLCEPLKPVTGFMEYEKYQKIMVDDYMQTIHPDLFAAGDVTMVANEPELLGVGWHRARLQGMIAGTNMAGQFKPYMIVPSLRFQIENYPVVVMGYADFSNRSNYKILNFADEKEHIYKQLFLQDDVIMGAVFAGNIDNMYTIEELIQSQKPFEANDYGTLLKLIQVEDDSPKKFSERFCPICKISIDFSDEIPESSSFECPICGVDLKLTVVTWGGLTRKVLFVNK